MKRGRPQPACRSVDLESAPPSCFAKPGSIAVAGHLGGPETARVHPAGDGPTAVEVAFDGEAVSVSEPESGTVSAAAPIPPDTLRLYRFRRISKA